MFTRRSIVTMVLLQIVTCGIYGLYYMVVTQNDIREKYSKEVLPSGGITLLLTLVTCGFYGVYWAYKTTNILNEWSRERNMYTSDDALMNAILFVFIEIVSFAIIQDKINNLLDNDNYQGSNEYSSF